MKTSAPLTMTLLMLALAASASFAQPKPQGSKLFPEVFDDDWTPPVRAEPKPIEPATRPAPQPGTVTPKTPEAVPPVVPGPVPVPETPIEPGTPSPALLEIPAADELTRTRKVMREVFAEQLKDHSTAGRQKLVEALVEEAEKQRDQPVDRYVLLSAVLQAAREAGDLDTVLKTADKLAAEYKVDALAIKTQIAGQMSFDAPTPAETSRNLKNGLALAEQLLANDDFAGAAKLVQAMQYAAASDAAAKPAVINLTKEIRYQQTSFEQATLAATRLKSEPNDPASLLALGSYLCFVKADWDTGLQLLSRSTHPHVAPAAAKDLQASAPAAAITAETVGDAWWEAFAAEPAGAAQTAMRKRCIAWYRKALDSGATSGLSRTRLEKRIESACAGQPLTFTFYKFCHEAKPYCYDIHGRDVPDELSISQQLRTIRISGTAKVDTARVNGKVKGSFGKSFLLKIPAVGRAQGTLVAQHGTSDTKAGRTNYFGILRTNEGSKVERAILKANVTYSWLLAVEGETVNLEVRDGGTVVLSMTASTKTTQTFGFGAACRYLGDKADVTITVD